MKFLTFVLHGASASWGDVAYGRHRPTLTQPTRSSVLGIIAASLGYGRADVPSHTSLSEALGVAVCTEAIGPVARDYHTAQTRAQERKAKPATRAVQMSGPRHELETMLSTRDYVHDALYSVALWKRSSAEPDLDAIGRALDSPVYPPFLGRRACAPGWPFSPRVVEASDVIAAIDGARVDEIDNYLGIPFARAIEPDWGRAKPSQRRLHADEDAPLTGQAERTVERRDVRQAWDRNLFSTRNEIELILQSRRFE